MAAKLGNTPEETDKYKVVQRHCLLSQPLANHFTNKSNT